MLMLLEPASKTIDWVKIDDGIRPLVQVLREAGYSTYTSCQGGEGHCFDRPTVGIAYDEGDWGYPEFKYKLAAFLRGIGLRSFTISHKTSYAALGEEAWCAVFVTISAKSYEEWKATQPL